jgi:DNA-binding LacI/PurR family transcriptional regulator
MQQPTPRPRKKRVSIEVVARKAGVSSMTVSRVIRGEPFVKEETRAHVIQVMRELGYVPSAAAQSLRSKDHLRSAGNRLFALIFGQGTESSVSFFHDITRGAEQAAAEAGLCPIQISLQENPELSWLRLQTTMSISGLCGALLVGQFTQDDIRFIKDNVRNVVMVDGPAPHIDGLGSVESSNFEGSLLALDHLRAVGCRRILVLTVEATHYFGQAMDQAASLGRSDGADIKTVFECRTSQDARDAVRRIWQDGERFDGMFTTDDFAIGALAAFRELGVKVPADVKIAGFDDILYASYTTPTLTSIRIDKFLLGREAVRTLVSMTHSPEAASGLKKVIRPSLVVRESTGGPREPPREAAAR